ncbi:hypothetical protein JCM6882_004485 [Rhodosporidiobolus microsporus]
MAPPLPSSLTPLTVLALALLVRLTAALLSRAFFQPDEYWQNLEPAYRWVFSSSSSSSSGSAFPLARGPGTGETWEWRSSTKGPSEERGWWTWEVLRTLLKEGGYGGIRSPLSVLPTAGVYWLLREVGWANSQTLVLVPRLLQGCFAASTDLALFLLARRVLGPRYAGAALLASLTSFFHFYTLSRTFSNSTETTLTTWALVFWPWPSPSAPSSSPSSSSPSSSSSLALALTFAATATLMRPSNAAIWLALGGQLILRARGWRQRGRIVRVAGGVGLLSALLSLFLDTSFYATPTFTPLRFLHFNLVRRVSHFYGTSSGAYYLAQGVPLLLLTQVPFFLDGILLRPKRAAGPGAEVDDPQAVKELKRTLAATVAVYSALEHKEWRFLHPVLPVMHLFVALSLVHRSSTSPASSFTTAAPATPATAAPAPRASIKKSHLALLLLSLPPAVYLTAFHGVGQARVMHYLSSVLHAERVGQVDGSSTVGFLMPCHSTGWQAFLDAPWMERDSVEGQRVWYLGCEPPVLGQNPSTYLDQSDHFYATPSRSSPYSPSQYLLTRFPPSSSSSTGVDPSFPPSPPLPPSPPDPQNAPNDLGWHHTWPGRFVLFSNLLATPCSAAEVAGGECGTEGTVGGLLRSRGYAVEGSWWNGLGGWNEDGRRRGRVVVLKWEGDEGEAQEREKEKVEGEAERGRAGRREEL